MEWCREYHRTGKTMDLYNEKVQEDGKMTGRNNLLTGRKAESIYTAMKKNHMDSKRQKNVCAVRHSASSFEDHLRRNAVAKVCYVYINGVSMPVLSA